MPPDRPCFQLKFTRRPRSVSLTILSGIFLNSCLLTLSTAGRVTSKRNASLPRWLQSLELLPKILRSERDLLRNLKLCLHDDEKMRLMNSLQTSYVYEHIYYTSVHVWCLNRYSKTLRRSFASEQMRRDSINLEIHLERGARAYYDPVSRTNEHLGRGRYDSRTSKRQQMRELKSLPGGMVAIHQPASQS